jgi:hypothetical protein
LAQKAPNGVEIALRQLRVNSRAHRLAIRHRPIRVHRGVNQNVGLAGELAALHHRATPQPIEPVGRLCGFEHIAQGVAFAYFPESEQHGDQSEFVVAEYVVAPTPFDKLPHPLENPQVVRAPVHQVPHRVQNKLIAKPIAKPRKQFLKLIRATLNIADKNVLGRSSGRRRHGDCSPRPGTRSRARVAPQPPRSGGA